MGWQVALRARAQRQGRLKVGEGERGVVYVDMEVNLKAAKIAEPRRMGHKATLTSDPPSVSWTSLKVTLRL